MTTVTLFKNSNGNVNVALKSGRTVAFILGRFFTVDKKLQAELQEAADADQEFGVYVDPSEPEIDPECATPMDQMKKRMRDELMAELASQGRLVDAGNSSQTLTQAGMTTTAGVAGQAPLSEEAKALAESQLAASGSGSAAEPVAGAVTEGSTLSALEKLNALKK